MKNSKVYNKIKITVAAELTNRLRQNDPDFENPEWQEFGTLEGVPVVAQYFTTQKDRGIANKTGDWGNADWDEALTDIWIDACGCDRDDTPEIKINQVAKKYGLEIN